MKAYFKTYADVKWKLFFLDLHPTLPMVAQLRCYDNLTVLYLVEGQISTGFLCFFHLLSKGTEFFYSGLYLQRYL